MSVDKRDPGIATAVPESSDPRPPRPELRQPGGLGIYRKEKLRGSAARVNPSGLPGNASAHRAAPSDAAPSDDLPALGSSGLSPRRDARGPSDGSPVPRHTRNAARARLPPDR